MARSLIGPVMLITLGVLFALDNFMQLPFSRTWPVILIVLGVFGLLRHWASRANGGPPRGAGPSSQSTDAGHWSRPRDPRVEGRPDRGAEAHDPSPPGDAQ